MRISDWSSDVCSSDLVTGGLELKAALIVPHAERWAGPSLLFEPYLHIMNFEFCVGVFSICEGVGSALWLRENNLDGSAADRIGQPQWKPSLINRSEEHTSELQSLMRISYAVFCLKKKKNINI